MTARTFTRPPALSVQPRVGAVPWKSQTVGQGHLGRMIVNPGRVDVMQGFLTMGVVGEEQRSKHVKNFFYQWLLFYLPQDFCKSPALMQKARPSPLLNRSLLPQLPGSESLSQRSRGYQLKSKSHSRASSGASGKIDQGSVSLPGHLQNGNNSSNSQSCLWDKMG